VRAIWKFPVPLDVRPRLWMPKGAKVLTFQVQGGKLCVWAEVDTEATTETRYFAVHGTGMEMPNGTADSDVYVGTVQISGFVWHLYELTGV
jgi:hypothetical protein